MSTNKRSEQSRINGAKSQGPHTPAGKSRSSRNAFKHGRFANNAVVLTNEDSGAFEELFRSYVRRIRPTDSVEMRLTRELASIDWRLARILALDTRLLDHEMAVQAPGLALESRALPELTRLVLAGRTLVDKSRFPAYLAERESKLNFTREATLRTLAALRTHHPLTEPSAQVEPPQPLNPEIDPRNEPETNPAATPYSPTPASSNEPITATANPPATTTPNRAATARESVPPPISATGPPSPRL